MSSCGTRGDSESLGRTPSCPQSWAQLAFFWKQNALHREKETWGLGADEQAGRSVAGVLCRWEQPGLQRVRLHRPRRCGPGGGGGGGGRAQGRERCEDRKTQPPCRRLGHAGREWAPWGFHASTRGILPGVWETALCEKTAKHRNSAVPRAACKQQALVKRDAFLFSCVCVKQTLPVGQEAPAQMPPGTGEGAPLVPAPCNRGRLLPGDRDTAHRETAPGAETGQGDRVG